MRHLLSKLSILRNSARMKQLAVLVSVSSLTVLFNNCGEGFRSLDLGGINLSSSGTSPVISPTPVPTTPTPTPTIAPPTPPPSASPTPIPTPTPIPPVSPTPTPVPPVSPTPIPPTPTPIPVVTQYIHFPAGGCSAPNQIQVEMNGLPHSQFPFIQPGDCFRENVNSATTTLRVRCYDSTNANLPSDWVGPAIVPNPPVSQSVCSRLLN